MKSQILVSHRANRILALINSLMKLVPMLVAPFLSRFNGSMQSRCVQRRNPRIFFPIAASFSSHGPQEPRQRQQRVEGGRRLPRARVAVHSTPYCAKFWRLRPERCLR